MPVEHRGQDEQADLAEDDRAELHSPPIARIATPASTSAIAMTITPSTSPAASLALITRMRFGTSVKVISAVRCDHSELTSRMPTIGSRMAGGRDREREHVAEDELVGVGEDAEQHDDGERERRDDQLQPEAGAGVDHLAQLDAGQAGEGRVHAGDSVRSKKSCSRPAPSDGPRWVRTTRPSSAARPTSSASASTMKAVLDVRGVEAGGRRGPRASASRVGRAHEHAGAGEQLLARAVGDDPAVADDQQVVGDRLDLQQQVRGEQHGAAAVGEVAQQAAHPADALGVEAVGGLVEDQHLRVAEQRVREPEPLAHAERVLAHALARRRTCRARRASSSSSTRAGVDAHHLGGDGERLAAAAARVLGARVEQHADAQARVRQLAVGGARARSSCRRRGPRARPASASWSSCRRRSVRGSPVTVPGSQRNETSLTTVRPPRRFVSPVASIMAPASGAAARATTSAAGRRRDRLR